MATATAKVIDVKVPGLGESVSEATIAKWLKSEGQQVASGEALAELETDKASMELPAPAAGVLHITKAKGVTVAVGEVIGQIDPAGKPTAGSVGDNGGAVKGAAAADALPPAVQKMVTENNLDVSKIAATGKDGRVTKEDVINHLARAETPARSSAPAPANAPAAPAAPARIVPSLPAGNGERRVEMSKLRQTIAKRLVEAQHATASLTTFNEVDLTAVMALREKYKERFEKAHNIGLGFMSFFAKAVVHAMRAVPAVNAMIDGTNLVYRDAVHLGVAVSTEKGLMVPVVRNAESLSFAQIEAEIKRLAGRAREGKITPDEMAGGSFTITNGGVFGSLISTPILNPPQSGILGMHKIEKRAVVVTDDKGADAIVVRPMMYVALTYDHRVIDGQQSVTFLVKVKEALEEPARLLLEV